MLGREAMLNKLLSTLPKNCEIIIIEDEDLLLAAKRNKGARFATREFLFFVDDDNYLKIGALDKMLSIFDETIGVMGMTACYSDREFYIADGGSRRNYLTGFTRGLRTNEHLYAQFSPGIYPVMCPRWDSWFEIYEVDEVANAFMIPRHIFEEAGGFDEENFPIDLDEADLCKRIKDMDYRIVMNPLAVCYHHSQTYSPIPNFRRKLNAYCMGNHRIRYSRKHLAPLSYWVHVIVFVPVFVCFYTLSLVWKRNTKMIFPFLHGVLDGLRNRRTNQYQEKPL